MDDRQMATSIKVTTDNVESLEGVLAAFRSDLDKLVRLTKKYPVELEFCGYRFVVSKQSEIQELITGLDEKIAEFRVHAA